MSLLHSAVKRPITGKSRNYQTSVFAGEFGSGGGTRTPDTRIMIPSVTLFSLAKFVNHRPNPPALTDSGRWSVNR